MALVLDGKTFAEATMVVALGITMTGDKRFLGFVETDTENEQVLTPFLRSLVERGLDVSQGLLVIVDGSKGLRAAVRKAFRHRALVQRCQWHTRENVVSYLAKSEQPVWRQRLQRAYTRPEYDEALAALQSLGPETVVDFARRFGFTSPIPPFLSVALGSAEATLMEATSAYSAFPNRGTRMVPYRIERIIDRAGDVLETGRPIPQDALRPDTAYIMVSLMRGVVQRGTAVRASRLNWPLGGKTGTMDDYTDAWFVGFGPDITVGVWVGYDEKKTLGDGEEGARVALPIWIDLVRAYIDGREAPEGFFPPDNIVFRSVDPMTGDVTEPWSSGALQEAFIAGTEPGSALFR